MASFDESGRRKSGKSKREVGVVCPRNFDDVEKLIGMLTNREGVIVDFDGIPPHLAQRMLDFLSGAVFALNGTVNKLKYKMYILIPSGVKINTIKSK